MVMGNGERPDEELGDAVYGDLFDGVDLECLTRDYREEHLSQE